MKVIICTSGRLENLITPNMVAWLREHYPSLTIELKNCDYSDDYKNSHFPVIGGKYYRLCGNDKFLRGDSRFLEMFNANYNPTRKAYICNEIKIVEIPDGTKYYIDQSGACDGYGEKIVEQHRVWE